MLSFDSNPAKQWGKIAINVLSHCQEIKSFWVTKRCIYMATWVIISPCHLLLEFNVNKRSRSVGDGSKCSCGKHHGSIIPRRPRHRSECAIHNLDLNRLPRNASFRDSGAYAPHQILPSTSCSIVPYSFSGRSEQVAWRKLWRITTKTGCSCMIKQKLNT